MDLKTLAASQAEFDGRHGWSTDTPDPATLVAGLQRDIVGLVGELGEFANIVQKIERNSALGAEPYAALTEQHEAMAEELADSFIYLIRLANRLGIDLEAEYTKKAKKNAERFAKFRR